VASVTLVGEPRPAFTAMVGLTPKGVTLSAARYSSGGRPGSVTSGCWKPEMPACLAISAGYEFI
jgi:hypothetical protein